MTNNMEIKSEFNALIDRMEAATEILYPERRWNEEFRVNIAFAWIGRESELLSRVERLETEAAKIKEKGNY